MPQEDKYKRETEKIGQLLALLMDRLMHAGGLQDPFSFVKEQLKSEAELDLDMWLGMNDKEDIAFLVSEKHFSTDHLRVLGDVLYQLAYKSGSQKEALLKRKALVLYEYISANNNGTLYYDLHYRIKELKHG